MQDEDDTVPWSRGSVCARQPGGLQFESHPFLEFFSEAEAEATKWLCKQERPKPRSVVDRNCNHVIKRRDDD